MAVTETLFALVATYGIWIVATSAYLSCLMLPVPTSAVMLAAGAFSASDDLVLWQIWLAAFLAAVLGDQTGFAIGRLGGAPLFERLKRKPKRGKLIERAGAMLDRWGGLGVFFSTWLVAPLGPWVNLIAGSVRLNWARFAFWDAAGEAIWVTSYLSLGYVFADRLEDISTFLGNSIGALTAGAVTILLGTLMFRAKRRSKMAKS